MQTNTIETAAKILKQDGVIAYPTEAMYGFGCDPFNKTAVLKLINIKQRSIDQGLILIAADWQQVADLTLAIDQQRLQHILNTIPCHATWLFPASPKVPTWIKGKHEQVAIRITAHPIATALCKVHNGPIVSTSANHHGQKPAKDDASVRQQFAEQVDFIVPGAIGNARGASEIRDAISGDVLRAKV